MNAVNTPTVPKPRVSLFQRFLDRSTPLTIISFILIGGTGVMLFFHFRGFGLKNIHEWAGVAFVLVAILHSVKHLRSFLRYLKFWPTWGAVAASIVVVVVLFFTSSRQSGGGRGPGNRGGEAAPAKQVHND